MIIPSNLEHKHSGFPHFWEEAAGDNTTPIIWFDGIDAYVAFLRCCNRLGFQTIAEWVEFQDTLIGKEDTSEHCLGRENYIVLYPHQHFNP